MTPPRAVAGRAGPQGGAASLTRRGLGLAGLAWGLTGHTQGGLLNPTLSAWLAGRPAVRFAPEANYGPFVYVDEHGIVRGLSVDLLALAATRLGMKLATVPARPLHEQLAAARRHEVDLISSLRPTADRAQFLLFTAPYVAVPAVLVMRADRLGADGLAGMVGRRVAVGQGYAVESVVRGRHPRVDWASVADDVQALQGVHGGRFDAAVVDAASAAFVMRRERLEGLASAGQVGFDYTLSFAVRSDWPQLRDIVDIGIRAIGQAERQAVLQRWMPDLHAVADGLRAPWASQIGTGLVVLAAGLGAAALWRSRRRPGTPA